MHNFLCSLILGIFGRILRFFYRSQEMASRNTPVSLLVSQAMQGQDLNVKAVLNVKKRRLDCGEGKGMTKTGVEAGSEAADELTEVLVCCHLLATTPHLAKELAGTWSPSLAEVVSSWNQKSGDIPALAMAGVNACTLEERITKRIILGHLLEVTPHLAKEWLNEHQGPTLSKVVSFWEKKGNPWVSRVSPGDEDGEDAPQETVTSQSTLSKKLSLMASQKQKPEKIRSGTKRARDKSPYFAPSPPPRKWVAPPGFGPDPSWHPPVSPFHLVEEYLYGDPWRLLVACIFLNKTTAKVAVPILETYFSRWGSPEAASAASETELCELLKPMGLQKKRAHMRIRFSREYLGPWTSPARDLHGIGKYAEDAWRLFCCGDLNVQPTDKELLRYLSWYRCSC